MRLAYKHGIQKRPPIGAVVQNAMSVIQRQLEHDDFTCCRVQMPFPKLAIFGKSIEWLSKNGEINIDRLSRSRCAANGQQLVEEVGTFGEVLVKRRGDSQSDMIMLIIIVNWSLELHSPATTWLRQGRTTLENQLINSYSVVWHSKACCDPTQLTSTTH